MMSVSESPVPFLSALSAPPCSLRRAPEARSPRAPRRRGPASGEHDRSLSARSEDGRRRARVRHEYHGRRPCRDSPRLNGQCCCLPAARRIVSETRPYPPADTRADSTVRLRLIRIVRTRRTFKRYKVSGCRRSMSSCPPSRKAAHFCWVRPRCRLRSSRLRSPARPFCRSHLPGTEEAQSRGSLYTAVNRLSDHRCDGEEESKDRSMSAQCPAVQTRLPERSAATQSYAPDAPGRRYNS